MARKPMNKSTVSTVAETETNSVQAEDLSVANNIEEKTKRVFKADDEILCRSVTQGKLFVDGLKTGMKYIFADYDEEAEIEYRDLVALVRARDKSVYNPRFIIMDEDFIEEYPALKKFYDDHFSTKNIKDILYLPDYQMQEEISKLPKTAVESLKSIAAGQIASGEIDSVRKIKALDAVFGTNLSLLSEIITD